MNNITISDHWLDNAPPPELDRLLVSYSDGSDHHSYTYKDVLDTMSAEDKKLKPSQILEKFYVDNDLGANNADCTYFDGEEHRTVEWEL